MVLFSLITTVTFFRDFPPKHSIPHGFILADHNCNCCILQRFPAETYRTWFLFSRITTAAFSRDFPPKHSNPTWLRLAVHAHCTTVAFFKDFPPKDSNLTWFRLADHHCRICCGNHPALAAYLLLSMSGPQERTQKGEQY